MLKNASPEASDGDGRHRIETWLLPGTRKKSGAVGANGRRNLLSNTVCATVNLASSEFGTTRKSCWVSGELAVGDRPRYPMAESIASTPGLAGVALKMVSGSGLMVTGQGMVGHFPVKT